jgi:hypothetical protein
VLTLANREHPLHLLSAEFNLLPRKSTKHKSKPASADVSEEGDVVEDGIMSGADAKRIDDDY